MYDILKEREKRRDIILHTLKQVIETLEAVQLLGPGKIHLSEWRMGRNNLIIPVRVEDRFEWEDVLNDALPGSELDNDDE